MDSHGLYRAVDRVVVDMTGSYLCFGSLAERHQTRLRLSSGVVETVDAVLEQFFAPCRNVDVDLLLEVTEKLSYTRGIYADAHSGVKQVR